ncbi:hypothetical protein Tco_0597800 [Tanacetum coccineum]
MNRQSPMANWFVKCLAEDVIACYLGLPCIGPISLSRVIYLNTRCLCQTSTFKFLMIGYESVGSPPSQVILFGDIPTVIPSTFVIDPETPAIAPVISSATLVVETTLVAPPTGLCGLVPYLDSDSDSPDEMDSP